MTNKLLLVPSIRDNPILTDDQQLDSDAPSPKLSVSLGLPLFHFLEISGDSQAGVQLKAQLFGQSRQKAHAGNFSSAITFGYKHSSDNAEVNSHGSIPDLVNGNVDSIIEYDWKMGTYNYGIVFGYRPFEKMIIYGGPRIISYEIASTIDQTRIDAHSGLGRVFKLNSSGVERSIGMGIELSFDPVEANQSIVYTLNVNQVIWGSYTSEIQYNHGILIKYFL